MNENGSQLSFFKVYLNDDDDNNNNNSNNKCFVVALYATKE